MEIRRMTGEEFVLSERLWSLCFPEDGEDFIRYYYSERTKPEYALGLFEDGASEPAAMLHMLPRIMRFNGEDKRVCFVAGVCTRPDKRRRGFCRRLFERAFELMRGEGYAACVLQPFDASFYEQFGFRTYANRRVFRLPHGRAKFVGRAGDNASPDPAELARMYADFMKGRCGYSVRDEEYFASFIREFSLKDAFIFTSAHGCCAGYYNGPDAEVFELFFDKDAGRDTLTELLPEVPGETRFALPTDFDISAISSGVLHGIPEDLGVEPFCMIKPIEKGFIIGNGEHYCLDRY